MALGHCTCRGAGGPQFHLPELHVQNEGDGVYRPDPHATQIVGWPGQFVPFGKEEQFALADAKQPGPRVPSPPVSVPSPPVDEVHAARLAANATKAKTAIKDPIARAGPHGPFSLECKFINRLPYRYIRPLTCAVYGADPLGAALHMAAGGVTELVARCRGCQRVRRSGVRVSSARCSMCRSRPTEAANRPRSRNPLASQEYRPPVSPGPSFERHPLFSHVRTRRDARVKHGLDAGPRRRQRTAQARWLERSGGLFPRSSTTAAGKPLRPRKLTLRCPMPVARLAPADGSAPRRRRLPSQRRTPRRGPGIPLPGQFLLRLLRRSAARIIQEPAGRFSLRQLPQVLGFQARSFRPSPPPLRRSEDLPRRTPHETGPDEHGHQRGKPRPLPGSRVRRVLHARPPTHETAPRRRQVHRQESHRRPRPSRNRLPQEDGISHPAPPVAARSARRAHLPDHARQGRTAGFLHRPRRARQPAAPPGLRPRRRYRSHLAPADSPVMGRHIPYRQTRRALGGYHGRRPSRPMKTLWVNSNFMHPTTKGGQIRTLEMLRHLHRWHEIHYVAIENPAQPEGPARAREYSHKSYPFPYRVPSKTSPAFYAELVRGLFSPTPVAVERFNPPGMRAFLEDLDRKSTRLNSSHRCISY